MALLDIFLLGEQMFNELNEEERRYNLNIMHRNIKDRSDPFRIPENRFRKIFRLSRELAFYLYSQLNDVMPESNRVTSIPNHLKVLLALNFYGYGSYQGIVGEDFNFPCSQPTVCRIIEVVTNAIIHHFLPNKIKFPTSPEDIQNTKLGFSNKFQFPNVIGCIDGTHVAIVSPPAEHELYPAALYYNRKGYTSINTLIICDAYLKILAINARFPGATHDSAIWQMSTISQYLRTKYFSGELNGWLLGDSGFPLQPWLLTPIENAPQGSLQSRYTERHTSTRNVIERLNGVLKSRFRCLLRHRTLHYMPPKAGKIIYACAILHNMCLEYNEAEIEEAEELEEIHDEIVVNNDEADDQNAQNNKLAEGRRIRNNLIIQHFQ